MSKLDYITVKGDPDRFAHGIGRPDLASEFQAIREQFQTPEDINDSSDSAALAQRARP